MTDDEKQKIRELSSAGRSLASIARELKCDRKTVSKVLGRAGKRDEEGAGGSPGSSSGFSSEGARRKAELVEEEGKVAQRVFSRLNRGESPELIVEKEALAPGVVEDLVEKWRKLKALPMANDLIDENKKLQATVKMNNQLISDLSRKVWAIEHTLSATPLSGLKDIYTCPSCGGRESLRVPVVCSKCGATSNWGWA